MIEHPKDFLTRITNKNDTTKALTLTFAIVGVIYIIVSSVSVLFAALGFGYLAEENSNICYDFKTLSQTLEDINKNCGSTFITKEWNSNEWTVFLSNVCDGKKCESKYIPLNECVFGEVDE